MTLRSEGFAGGALLGPLRAGMGEAAAREDQHRGMWRACREAYPTRRFEESRTPSATYRPSLSLFKSADSSNVFIGLADVGPLPIAKSRRSVAGSKIIV